MKEKIFHIADLKKSILYNLVVFPCLLLVLSVFLFYSSSVYPISNVPERLEKIIEKVETGEIGLTEEKMKNTLKLHLNVEIAQKKTDIALVNAIKSLSFLLLILGLLQLILIFSVYKKVGWLKTNSLKNDDKCT
jgi:predicted PurR-regulated permease PerM